VSVVSEGRVAFARGVDDGRLVAADPAAASRLSLGDVDGAHAAAPLLHLLHSLHVPYSLVCLLAGFFPGARATEPALRYAYWKGAHKSLPGPLWRSLFEPPVVVMYHAFAIDGEAASRYVVTGARFRRQMQLLRLSRRRVISLSELARHRAEGTVPPPRSVVITLDDGYRDNLEVAAPILARGGFPATVFVVSGTIGGVNRWDSGHAPLAGRPMLSAGDLRALCGLGLEIGAHTRSHRMLRGLPAGLADDEIAGSRADLEALLGAPVEAFSYPYGAVDAAAEVAVARAGMTLAVSVDPGRNGPAVARLRLRRVEIRGDWSLARFWLAIRFGDGDVLAGVGRRLARPFAGLKTVGRSGG